MDIADLRVALFSGNYNYVRDGANQALNRLVDYLLRQGAAVRVYAPVVEPAAFPPTGDLVGVPAVPIPSCSPNGRSTGCWTCPAGHGPLFSISFGSGYGRTASP